MKLIKTITAIFTILVSAIVLVATLRGVPGNPSPQEIRENLRDAEKPFELSPERGRYAIIQSFVEDKSLSFSKDVAEYVVPDLGYKNGKFVSLFAPGVSFVALPFYLIGKSYQLAQVGAFATNSLFALLNLILISLIVKKLTKNYFAGLVAGLTFVFGTIALAYSATLYQHHITSFLLLFSLYLLLDKAKFYTAFLVLLFFGLSFFVEYPNVVFFLPILTLLLTRHVSIEELSDKSLLKIKSTLFIGVAGLLLSLIPTFLYNSNAYGSPTQLAGTVRGIKSLTIDWETGSVQSGLEKQNTKTALGFFKTEKLPNSMTVLLTSKDRGLVYFSPVVLLGLLGIYSLYKKRKDIAYAVVGVIGVILLLYGMWGDPWGGWAFGPRYLIPAIAFAAVLLGVAIHAYGRRWWFIILFAALFIYSSLVSLAGALTTNQLPPSVEIDYLKYPKLIFLYNFDLIKQGMSGSFVYNNFFKNIVTLQQYAVGILCVINLLVISCYIFSIKKSKGGEI